MTQLAATVLASGANKNGEMMMILFMVIILWLLVGSGIYYFVRNRRANKERVR
jgi:LPXTG-motif cell wall-anchored protein